MSGAQQRCFQIVEESPPKVQRNPPLQATQNDSGSSSQDYQTPPKRKTLGSINGLNNKLNLQSQQQLQQYNSAKPSLGAYNQRSEGLNGSNSTENLTMYRSNGAR